MTLTTPVSKVDGHLIYNLIILNIGILIYIGINIYIYIITRPYVLELESYPLPSDCLYRLDLLFMKMKDNSRG